MKIAHASFAAAITAFGGPWFGGPDAYLCESHYQLVVGV